MFRLQVHCNLKVTVISNYSITRPCNLSQITNYMFLAKYLNYQLQIVIELRNLNYSNYIAAISARSLARTEWSWWRCSTPDEPLLTAPGNHPSVVSRNRVGRHRLLAPAWPCNVPTPVSPTEEECLMAELQLLMQLMHHL